MLNCHQRLSQLEVTLIESTLSKYLEKPLSLVVEHCHLSLQMISLSLGNDIVDMFIN